MAFRMSPDSGSPADLVVDIRATIAATCFALPICSWRMGDGALRMPIPQVQVAKVVTETSTESAGEPLLHADYQAVAGMNKFVAHNPGFVVL